MLAKEGLGPLVAVGERRGWKEFVRKTKVEGGKARSGRHRGYEEGGFVGEGGSRIVGGSQICLRLSKKQQGNRGRRLRGKVDAVDDSSGEDDRSVAEGCWADGDTKEARDEVVAHDC